MTNSAPNQANRAECAPFAQPAQRSLLMAAHERIDNNHG